MHAGGQAWAALTIPLPFSHGRCLLLSGFTWQLPCLQTLLL